MTGEGAGDGDASGLTGRIQMELLVARNGCPGISAASDFGLPRPKPVFYGDSFDWRRIRRRSANIRSAFLSIRMQSARRCSRNRIFASEQSAASVEELGKDGDAVIVEVVGIGSRKDTLLDFCLESPFFDSTVVRFWCVIPSMFLVFLMV